MKIKKLFLIPVVLLLIQPLLLSYNENEEGFPSSFDRELFEPFKSINAGYNAQADNLEKELNDASNTYSNISTASSTSDATNKMDNAANQKKNEKEQQEHTAEEKIEEYKTQSQDMQDSINSSIDGDPVRITQGAYEQNETDISFGKNLVFKIMRKYSSQNPVTSSFGYGWSTNLDERILFGTLTNCHEVEQALTSYVDKMKETVDKMEKLIISSYSVPNIDNAYSTFSSRITTCRDVINKASQLYSSLDSLTSEAVISSRSSAETITSFSFDSISSRVMGV